MRLRGFLIGGIVVILVIIGVYTLRTRQIRQIYLPYVTPLLNRIGVQPIYSRKVSKGVYEQVVKIPQYGEVKIERYFEGEIITIGKEGKEIREIEIKEGAVKQRVEFLRGGPVLVFDENGRVVDERSLLEGMEVRAYFTEREGRFISHKVYIL